MRSLKILLLSVFIVLVSGSVSAQGFGVRAGANFSDINGSGLDTSFNSGLYIGVFREMTLIKSLLFIQPELEYSQQGFELNKAGSTKKYNIDYLTVPVLAKVYALKLLSFETGPEFGFPISDNLDSGVDTKSFVTSWAFGMSINLPLHLSINGRYIAGLTDTYSTSSSKSQVFQIGAAFRL